MHIQSILLTTPRDASRRRCARHVCRLSIHATHLASLATILLTGCAASTTRGYIEPQYAIVKLPGGARVIWSDQGPLDSPALSFDGRQLAVQVELFRHAFLPYEVYSLALSQCAANGKWAAPTILRHGRYHACAGRMKMPIQPSFAPDGESLVFTHIEADTLFGIPLVFTLRSWIGRLWPTDQQVSQLLNRHDAGFSPNELLQHAQLSPDGRWMTFYTRVHTREQGVYLYDFDTGRLVRLSDQHDKHPTFGAEGRRIYFHHQYGGKRHRFDFFASGTERAILGYFELTFDADGDLQDFERVLMDDPNGPYCYHKHPAPLPGTDLLFFHGATKPDGKKRLMVRRAFPGSAVFIVQPTVGDLKFKELKHPCCPRRASELVCIAKPRGERRYTHLLQFTPGALEHLELLVCAQDQTAHMGGAGFAP